VKGVEAMRRDANIAFLDSISRLKIDAKAAKRMNHPYALRIGINLKPSQMAEILMQFVPDKDRPKRPWTRKAIWQWEKAHCGRYSLARYGTSVKAREAYRALIITVIEQSSGGRLTARVAMTGPHARRWKVTPIKTKGIK
jgi:hypothetical protein